LKAFVIVVKDGNPIRVPVNLKSAKKVYDRTANPVEDYYIERMSENEKARKRSHSY